MNENDKCHWKKVSFTEYLNKDGSIIHTKEFSLHGEVLTFHDKPIDNGFIRVASVSCVDGELYFVPFDSLVYMDKV